VECGLQAKEALQLAVKDIDRPSGKLKVRQGKGKKDRAGVAAHMARAAAGAECAAVYNAGGHTAVG
jgi:hypothetical protein